MACMIVKMPSVAQGVNRDAHPEELPLGMWSSVNNMAFRDGFLARAGGMRQIFDDPAITPLFVAPFRTATSLYWIHIGTAAAYVDDGTTRTDITRTSPFTGTVADRWTGGPFNGIFIANNGVDPPQYWNGNTATNFADLPNWTANYTCKALRAFKNFLVALDVTKTGTRYPFRVLWSAIADPGSVPPSWDVADTTREAGEIDIEGAAGPLIDAVVLGDSLILYTTASAHAMRYVGGQSVFSFSKLSDVGMLARNCGANTPVGHVILTTGDVVLLQGGGPSKSIASTVVRRAIFSEMDSTYAERAAFVTTNPAQNEVWVCYPTSGTTCSKAAVWNWVDNVWTFRDLRTVTAGASGQVPAWNDGTDTWDTAAGTWATDTTAWGAGEVAPNEQRLVLAHTLPALSVVGAGQTDVGLTFTATAERIGLHFDDPQTVKRIRSVWPRIDADAGTVVLVEVGASMKPDVAPTWNAAVSFTVGTTTKVDSMASGRYLALRLSSAVNSDWRVRGVDLDIVPMGAR
jgi:hypothetical protein